MYDLVIVGSGPAGLSASVYASRYGISNVVIGEITGGLISETHEIGNWLGTQKISGFEFSQKAKEHAESLGAKVISMSVEQIRNRDDGFQVQLSSGDVLESKAVLIAAGSKHRRLNVPGEEEFKGKGVSYCATCDGFFFRNKAVAVVGGSNSAAGAAVYLSNLAEKVYIVYRKDKLRAEEFWLESIRKNSKIEVVYNINIVEICGLQKVEQIILDKKYQGSDSLKLDGVFVEIGHDPNNKLVRDLGIELDGDGLVVVDSSQKTNVKGVWAAGDLTTGSNGFRQIVTAASEGAIAADDIGKYLKSKV